MHFDLFDLRLFVFAAEEGNLRRGAERACISLAAASTRIKQLEENLGSKVLYRKAHGVELTPAGNALLHHARRVLQQVDHLMVELRGYGEGLRGHVRIRANTTAITSTLPAALASFLAHQPQVDIDLQERLSHEIVIDLHEARADIGIAAGDVDTTGLEVRSFGSDELVVVVPASHALGALAQVPFVETLGEPQISLQDGSALAGFLPPIARTLGHSLDFRIQVGSFEAICLLVEAGVGIGIIPRSSALRHARTMDLRIVELSDAWARRELKLLFRADSAMPKLAMDLVEHLVRAHGDQPRRRARLRISAAIPKVQGAA